MVKRLHSGFTLIEILAAMAILSVIVLVAGRIMVDGSAAYEAGISSSQMNDNARSVMDFISRDISAAIAGSTNLIFSVDSSTSTEYGNGDILRFVKLEGEPSGVNRSVTEVIYSLTNLYRRVEGVNIEIPDRYRLMRSSQDNVTSATAASNVDAYRRDDWWNTGKESDVIIENVSRFYIYAYTTATNYNTPADVLSVSSSSSWGTALDFNSTKMIPQGLPFFLDIYLEVLDEDTAIRVEAMKSSNNDQAANELITRNAQRYSTRVHFVNRQGYLE